MPYSRPKHSIGMCSSFATRMGKDDTLQPKTTFPTTYTLVWSKTQHSVCPTQGACYSWGVSLDGDVRYARHEKHMEMWIDSMLDHVRSMVRGSVHAMEEMCISRGGPLRSRIHEAPICVTRSVMGQFGSQLSEPETPWMSTLQNLQIHCCLLPSVCLRLRCELTTSDDDSPNISLGLGICCYTAPFVKTHRCFRRKVTAHCPV